MEHTCAPTEFAEKKTTTVRCQLTAGLAAVAASPPAHHQLRDLVEHLRRELVALLRVGERPALVLVGGGERRQRVAVDLEADSGSFSSLIEGKTD